MPYEYRRLSKSEQAALLAQRRDRGLPLHEPPHFPQSCSACIITGANFEHRRVMSSLERRLELLQLFQEEYTVARIECRAWIVLPNHYHFLLVDTSIEEIGRIVTRVHRITSHRWKRQDRETGKAPAQGDSLPIWFRFSDRRIRSASHYWATVNYIHTNAAKHGWIQRPEDWKPSSLESYIEEMGREKLRAIWRAHPVRDYGKGWDD